MYDTREKVLNIKALLDIIFKTTNTGANILADMYLLKNVSTISRWKSGKVTPTYTDLQKVIEFAVSESTEVQQVKMRKQIEDLIMSLPLDEELAAVILNKNAFSDFLLEALSVSLLPKDKDNKSPLEQEREFHDEIDTKPIAETFQQTDYISSKKNDVVFLYNMEDRPVVKKIGAQLKEFGILSWVDIWSIRPGVPWREELEEQINDIEATVVFIGKSSTSILQDGEINTFLQQMLERKRPVIPVILPGCRKTPRIPRFLSCVLWVDFRRNDTNPIEQLAYGIDCKCPFYIEEMGQDDVKNRINGLWGLLKKSIPVFGYVLVGIVLVTISTLGVQNIMNISGVSRKANVVIQRTGADVTYSIEDGIDVAENRASSSTKEASKVSDSEGNIPTTVDKEKVKVENTPSPPSQTSSDVKPSPVRKSTSEKVQDIKGVQSNTGTSTQVLNSDKSNLSEEQKSSENSSKTNDIQKLSPEQKASGTENAQKEGSTGNNYIITIDGDGSKVVAGENIVLSED
ncbi:MAG: TIR domain-containing protein [Clostridia bacterium]|nr:TIR domain-containing protein [Clostridia bacterium]